jgi:hypothetical protein
MRAFLLVSSLFAYTCVVVVYVVLLGSHKSYTVDAGLVNQNAKVDEI